MNQLKNVIMSRKVQVVVDIQDGEESQNWIHIKIYRSRFVVFICSRWVLRFPKFRRQRRQKKDNQELICDFIGSFYLQLYLLGPNAAKINDCIKSGSNKSCFGINFLQKTQWTHISIFPRGGDGRLQRWKFFKYYNIIEWESTFTLWLEHCKK